MHQSTKSGLRAQLKDNYMLNFKHIIKYPVFKVPKSLDCPMLSEQKWGAADFSGFNAFWERKRKPAKQKKSISINN